MKFLKCNHIAIKQENAISSLFQFKAVLWVFGTAFWHQETGTVVIRTPSALDGGTPFQPRKGINYVEKELR